MDKSYYIIENGQISEPLSKIALSSKNINPETQVCPEFGEWTAAKNIEDLADFFIKKEPVWTPPPIPTKPIAKKKTNSSNKKMYYLIGFLTLVGLCTLVYNQYQKYLKKQANLDFANAQYIIKQEKNRADSILNVTAQKQQFINGIQSSIDSLEIAKSAIEREKVVLQGQLNEVESTIKLLFLERKRIDEFELLRSANKKQVQLNEIDLKISNAESQKNQIKVSISNFDVKINELIERTSIRQELLTQ